MKIGDVAQRLDTTARTLRFYEEHGLVTPARTPGGTRNYSEKDLERFETILTLASLDVPLGDIALLVNARTGSASGDEASRKVDVLLATLIANLQESIEDMQLLLADTERARSIVAKCKGCKNVPTPEGCPDCPVRNELGAAQLLSLIWDDAQGTPAG